MPFSEVFHRGLRPDQEKPNSFDALVKVNPGDVIEMDTIILKDGTLVMAHPKDLGKTIEELEGLTQAEFQQLQQPRSHSESEKMPLLKESLFQLHDRGAKLYLELKASTPEKIILEARAVVQELDRLEREHAFPDEQFLKNGLILHAFSVEGTAALVQELQQHQLNIPVFLQWNKSPEFAKEMKISETGIEHAAQITTTNDWTEKGMVIAKNIECSGIAMHISVLINNPEYIQKAHEYGLQVAGGGPIEPDKKEELLKAGLDVYVY